MTPPTCSNTSGFFYCEEEGKILNPGTYTIHCNFIPYDNSYSSILDWSVTTTLTVLPHPTKTTPVIDWNNPTDISNTTPLSVTQLNATSITSGTFVYTPNKGTLLPVGTNIPLNTVMTPNDTDLYTNSYATVYINVIVGSVNLVWNNPSQMFLTEALSSTQLNAFNNEGIGGTYNYTPSAGTYLTLGSHTLNVVFTPFDTRIPTASATTSITVIAPINPNLTWTPNPIYMDDDEVIGTHLNAEAKKANNTPVSGTFGYKDLTS
jgi:hypothetical protein